MQRHLSNEIDPNEDPRGDALRRVAMRYAVAITPAMSRLIEPDRADDPIARQFMPDPAELDTAAGENADPIGDHVHEVVKGLIHRYPDRVLLKIVQVCAVYCRFCFRREMVGPENGAPLTDDELSAALGYIRATPAIWEVILSGGDPLVLSPRRVREVTAVLGEIDHVKVLRWHTRLPVVAPERITGELVAALRASRPAVWMALHVNHAKELTPEARAAISRLVDGGIAMVSQSVLLAGVNDDAETLEDLFRGLIEVRVKPYYLHHLDKAPGTGHFRTSISEGQALVASLRGRMSGLAQPTYVLDLPGGYGKVPMGPSPIEAIETGDGVTTYAIRDGAGCCHSYADPAPASIRQASAVAKRRIR